MDITTMYRKTGETEVEIRLVTAEEQALTDDLLARIGANQHLLHWPNRIGLGVEIGDRDPATFRLGLQHRNYTVFRSSDPATGAAIARVVYGAAT